MKFLIIQDYKDKKEPKIEGLILLDTFCRCYYAYDSSERNLKKLERRLKNYSINDNSSMFDLYLSFSDKIKIDDKIFNEIINMKIKKIHTFTLKDFLMKFKLYEWLI